MQAIRPDLDGHDRDGPAEVANDPVSDAAEASLHEPLDRGDVLALGKGMSSGRQMGLGHERGLEFDQHSHRSPLGRLLVKLGCDERLFLRMTGSRDQKGEQHG